MNCYPRLFAAAVFALFITAAQARTWTNSEGKELVAELIGVNGDNVQLRRQSDGRTFEIPVASLSAEDQAFIQEQAASTGSATPGESSGNDWPGWRGADQSGISPDTGLLKSWPSGGPELLWTYENAGNGYSSYSVVGGKLYTLGARETQEILICLDAASGDELWTADVGVDPQSGYNTGWGGGPRSTPTVSDGMIYVLGVAGDVVCFDAETGKEKWRKNLVDDFGGQLSKWGYSESPTVDGDKVLVTPGGKDGAIVTLDKNSGRTIWQSEDLTDRAEYSSVVVAEVDGKKQYIQLFEKTLAGVDAESGDVIWTSNWDPGKVAVIPTPIYHDGYVYMTSGYGAGAKLVKISGGDAEDVWENTEMVNHHGGVVLVGDHVYGFTDKKRGNLMCQELMTGEVAWMEQDGGNLKKGAVHMADGMLYCLNEDDGTVTLVEVNPRSFSKKGQFKLPKESKIRADKGKIWSHPVVIGGKLYLRDQEYIFCYDVKG
ncbi:MAG: PQQ-binding-like beta-propeller repeat protein [Verrucomicrobiota bacterium]